ncbi:queuosine salvage family protein [Patescibacteria group bacterium]|nr:queuosine salvage family protein [Patescibacteria group bacterium]
MPQYTAGQIDNAIWLISQNIENTPPHHRTRTIYY